MLSSQCLGKVELHEDNVENLLSAACLLQLPAVVDACSTFCRKLLHPSNCIGIQRFADTQGCLQLRDYSQRFTEDNFQVGVKHFFFLH